MPVTQELAAASGTPPAFRKQLELCCIFRTSATVSNIPAELRCGVLHRLRNNGNHALLSSLAVIRHNID